MFFIVEYHFSLENSLLGTSFRKTSFGKPSPISRFLSSLPVFFHAKRRPPNLVRSPGLAWQRLFDSLISNPLISDSLRPDRRDQAHLRRFQPSAPAGVFHRLRPAGISRPQLRGRLRLRHGHHRTRRRTLRGRRSARTSGTLGDGRRLLLKARPDVLASRRLIRGTRRSLGRRRLRRGRIHYRLALSRRSAAFQAFSGGSLRFRTQHASRRVAPDRRRFSIIRYCYGEGPHLQPFRSPWLPGKSPSGCP